VTIAQAAGGRIAIASGLAAGEHVVVNGQLRLTPGARVVETPPGKAPAEAETSTRGDAEDRS
jgi:multidrug efflux system membrane fusion protein